MSSTYQTVAAVGLFSSGLAAGLTLSYPLLINPHFRSIEGGIPIKHRLQIWNKSYDFGVSCIPFVALGSTLAFFATAWLVPDAPVALKRSSVLSGVFHISIVPFTIFAMVPTNKTLMGMRKKANDPVDPQVYTEDDVRPLFARWAALHNVRTGLSLAGFAVAILNFLDIYRL